ncbi:MAG: VOC family protein [Actinomycetota bacterium]|nr:hypothetical protein [Actinomycetota bacterium]
MAVGGLRSIVLDVNDLEESERFWSSVLGLEVQWPSAQGQFRCEAVLRLLHA